MKRLLALALAFIGALSLTISGVIIIERNRHPAVLTELHRCQAQMCLFGIMPIQTLLSDARDVVKQSGQFTIADFSANTAFKRFTPYYRLDLMRGTCSSNIPDCVGEIELVFRLDENNVSAGQVIPEFGPPCGIVPDVIPGRTALYYPGMVLIFMSDVPSTGKRFQPILLLGQINIFKNAASCEQLASQVPRFLRWRGFTIYP